MRIYTRTGDEGRTGIIGGRVDKDDAAVEAYGTIDELNCFVGQSICLLDNEHYSDLKNDLFMIQHELFDCGADLAILERPKRGYKVSPDMVEQLEHWIDLYDQELADITRFILPGGSSGASSLHVCRTVCRRAERRVVTLSKIREINPHVVRYLNRLSDYFFTAARAVNRRGGVTDVEYLRSAEVFRNQP